jgi:hypothetical protein
MQLHQKEMNREQIMVSLESSMICSINLMPEYSSLIKFPNQVSTGLMLAMSF